jgi:SEC-C motif domain protein
MVKLHERLHEGRHKGLPEQLHGHAQPAGQRSVKAAAPAACPCGGQPAGAPYAQCCGRLIDAQHSARDASELMRARYTAYVLQAYPYLRQTWRPDTCPADLEAAPHGEPRPRWLGLSIKRSVQHDATHAEVEFVARYKLGGRAHRLHEISRFEHTGERWCYVDGDVLT